MGLNLAAFIPNLFAFLFFVVLVGLFIYQSQNQNRPVGYVLTSMIMGSFTTLGVLIWSTLEDKESEIAWILRSCYLIISGIQFLFFFFFIENSNSLKPSRTNVVIITILLGSQILGMIAFNIFYQPGVTENLKFLNFFKLLGRIGYNGLGVFIFGVLSLPIYYRMYKYTKETRAIILFTAAALIAGGYFITFIFDIFFIYNEGLFVSGSFLRTMLDIGNNVPMIGLGTFAILYAFNLEYIYRLPFDHYVMVVAYRSGLNILSVPFETKHKEIGIQEQLFTGMLTAINGIYTHVFESEKLIETIASKDLSIVMDNGKYISVIVATEHPSGILKRGMKLFVKKFEATFAGALERKEKDVMYFESAKNIFNRIFPFLESTKE